VSGAGTSWIGGGPLGGGSVGGGCAVAVGLAATSVGEAPADGAGGELVAAAAPPGSSVPTSDAARMPRITIAIPMSPINPRRSVLDGGALECATLPPQLPRPRGRRIPALLANTR